MRPRLFVVPMLVSFALGARGDEPSKRVEDVFSEVDGERTIVYIAPDGAHVTKGQVVCVLDSGARPINPEVAVAQAETNYRQAVLTREVAETAAKEFEEGAFKKALETISGNVAMATADLKRAQDRYEWSRRMLAKKYASQAQHDSDKLSLDKARFTLERANTSRAVLLKYTKQKTVKELRAEVEKARSDELAKKATLDLERAKAKVAEKQSRARVVLAPTDGTVKLARPTKLVEAGAEVCKDQLLLRIVPQGK